MVRSCHVNKYCLGVVEHRLQDFIVTVQHMAGVSLIVSVAEVSITCQWYVVQAEKKKIYVEDLTAKIVGAGGPTSSGTKAEACKFHDDKSQYTGMLTHFTPLFPIALVLLVSFLRVAVTKCRPPNLHKSTYAYS